MPKESCGNKKMVDKINVDVAVMKTEIKYIKDTQEEHGTLLKDIHEKIDKGFQKIAETHPTKEEVGKAVDKMVTRKEFGPVQKIAYSTVGLICFLVIEELIRRLLIGG